MRIFFLGVGLLQVLVTSAQPKLDSVLKIPYEQFVSDYSVYNPLYKQAIQEAREVGDSTALALLLERQGIIQYLNGNQDQCAEKIMEAIAIYRKQNNQRGLASMLGLLGYQLKRRDLDKAESYMRQAKTIQEAFKDTFELLITYDNYGVIKEFREELDSASYFYKLSLSLKRLMGDTNGIPFSLNNLAIIAKMKGQYKKAIAYLDSSDAIRGQMGNAFYNSQNAAAKGEVYAAWDRLDSAIKYYKQSVDLALKEGLDYLVRDGSLALSKIYQSERDFEEALTARVRYENYKDSIVNESTNQNLNSLLVQFETAEKEKKIAEQNAMLAKEALKARNQQFIILIAIILLLSGLVFARRQIKKAILKRENAEREGILKLQSERVRVSRDLHDHIGSELTLIASSANRQAKQLTDPEASEKVKTIASNARNAMDQLRETIWAINPDGITLDGLVKKLELHATRMTDATEMSLEKSYNIQNPEKQLGPTVTINVFRVCQEALNNACKYSNGNLITFKIWEDDGLNIQISDDGNGFDIEQSEMGYGLVNMKARMEEVGGRFSINANTGKGCSILLKSPFNL